MKPKTKLVISRSSLGLSIVVSMISGTAPQASADIVTPITPEVSITAPSAIRAVQGATLNPMSFSATNLNAGIPTTFDLGLTAGSVGQFNSLSVPAVPSGTTVTSATGTPWIGVSLGAGIVGTISTTPNISGLTAGQTMNFGIQATNAFWNAPVSASSNIQVVTDRLLTGSATINAGRHMAGLQSIGNITLSGGAATDTEATRISVSSGGYAQLANGLRLTSATDFTFNGANQTHDLQISYNRPTGTYNITAATLPGAGASSYTDASGNARQDFGGAWKTSAEYGNVFGQKQVFTEQNSSDYYDAPGANIAWRKPGVNSGSYQEAYVYNQQIASTPQPTASPIRSTGNTSSWEVVRGAGPLVNERIDPLISGEVIQGSSLNLSGVTLSVAGTAVADRAIYGGTVDLGRRMVGTAGLTITRSDTVTLGTTGSAAFDYSNNGSDEHRTRLNLQALSMDNGAGTTAVHVGNTAFTDSAHTATVQLTGNFTLSTATQGRNFQGVNAGSSIIGEGLVGENKQSNLQLGYSWNNVQNNQLYADSLLVIDSNTASGTRTYYTYAGQVHSRETHTNIGVNGGYVEVSGALATGVHNLGNRTVTAIAEGLAGENASATASFNTRYASVAAATFTATNTGPATGPLGDGNTITIRDTGSSVFQNNVSIKNVALSGGQNLDYQLIYGGGDSLIEHGTARAFTIDYVGNSSPVLAGQLGRISRADLSIGLEGRINYSGITSASGVSGSYRIDNHIYRDSLATQNYELETRFNAPAAAAGSSVVAAGTDFGVNGLSLTNTNTNTSSERFVRATDVELLDSNTLASSTNVQVQFVKLSTAAPSVVAALEDDSKNAASRAGIYGGDTNVTFVSDIINLTGLDGVMQVVQIGYDASGTTGEEGAQLLWRYDYTGEGGSAQVAWINAVLGNSNITGLDLSLGTLSVGGGATTIQDYLDDTRFEGSYAEYLADNNLSNPALGMWGYDLDNDKVWAVIDHNSSFAASVPEPSSSLLILFGLGGLALRRKRN